MTVLTSMLLLEVLPDRPELISGVNCHAETTAQGIRCSIRPIDSLHDDTPSSTATDMTPPNVARHPVANSCSITRLLIQTFILSSLQTSLPPPPLNLPQVIALSGG